MKRIYLLLLYTLLCVSLHAQAELADSALIPMDKAYKIGKLKNGLAYYLRYNNYPEKRACFYLVQRVGSLQEEENQRGLAHFLEHMCFNGSQHFKGNAVEHYCESLGVDDGGGVNAYTSIEETVYNIDDVPTTVGQERLDSCLLILYDWAHALTLDSVEIEKERGVIHEEWRMSRDADERVLDRQLPVLYPGCKYGVRMPIGLMEVVDNFQPQQLRDYYEKWYNPQNQCIVVVGDIDLEHTEAKIHELFDGIVPSPTSGVVQEVPVEDHPGIIYSLDKDKELRRNTVNLLFKHKAYTPEDRKYIGFWKECYRTSAALDMLNERYSDEALKEDCAYQWASASDDDYIYSSTKGAFQLDCGMKDGMQSEALTAMLAECRRAAEYGFTPEEYKRYQADMMATCDNYLLSADKQLNTNLVDECKSHFLYGSVMISPEDYVRIEKEIVLSTSLEEINQRMKELLPLQNENLVLMSWNTEKEGADYPTQEELYAALLRGREQAVEPYVDRLKDAKFYPEEPQRGSIVKEEKNAEMDYTKWTLSNGTTVYLKPTDITKSDVHLKVYGPGGWTLFGAEDQTNIWLFNSLSFGNNGLSNSDISKLLAGKIAGVSQYMGSRDFQFEGHCDPKDMETLLQLLYAQFTCPSKDMNEFRTTLDQRCVQLENRKTVPEAAFADSVFVMTKGHHPRHFLMTAEKLCQVDFDRELEMFKQQTQNAAGFSFIFVGNLDVEKMRPWVEKYIASLPANPDSIRRGHFLNTWQKEDQICHFTRQMETPKCMVNLNWHTEDIPYTMLNRIMMDISCRVLNMVYSKVIREENSATYDCSVDYYLTRGEGSECLTGFEAECSMKPEKCDEVISLMKEEFRKLPEEMDPTMFQNAKESMLTYLDEVVKLQNGYWVDAIWEKEHYGLDLYLGRRELIENLTIPQVQEFLKKLQLHAHCCEVLMQPE